MWRYLAEEAQKTLEESMAMSMGDHQELALDYYRSKSANGTISAMGTLSRRAGQKKQAHNQPPPILGKLGKLLELTNKYIIINSLHRL